MYVTMPKAEAIGLGSKFVAVIAIGVLVLALPKVVAAGSSLAPLTVIKLKDQLCISTRLEGGFSKTVTETITSGIPASFSYEIELWHERRLWTDQSIATKAFERVVKFNSLKSEFQVSQNGNTAHWGRTSRNLEEVKNWVTRLDALPMIKIEDLDPTKKYYVRARATVETDQSRSALKYMLFLISPLKMKTPWKQSVPFLLEDVAVPKASMPSSTSSVANP